MVDGAIHPHSSSSGRDEGAISGTRCVLMFGSWLLFLTLVLGWVLHLKGVY
jgi:hypothetical protein